MNAILRVLTTAVLLIATGLCLFGYLATYESPDFLVWRVGYAGVGLLCLGGVAGVTACSERRAVA